MMENQNTKPLQFNLSAHYTDKIKLEQPKLSVAQAPMNLPKIQLFSDKEADRKMQFINNDIYIGTKKEKANNEFNKNLYLKIFAICGLVFTGVACFSKIRNFFRKS